MGEGLQEEVPGSSQGPEGRGQPAPPINKGGLKKPRLVTYLSQLQGVGGVQKGQGREKRMGRSRKKRGERESGWDICSAPQNPGTEEPSGQHLPLGGDFRLGPQLGLSLS